MKGRKMSSKTEYAMKMLMGRDETRAAMNLGVLIQAAVRSAKNEQEAEDILIIGTSLGKRLAESFGMDVVDFAKLTHDAMRTIASTYTTP
jgi:ribosomal protein S4E